MASDRKKRYTFFTDIRRNPLSYGMLIPAALYTILFGYLTIPFMFIAFEKFNYRQGLFGSEWAGLSNFEFFFKSNSAPRVHVPFPLFSFLDRHQLRGLYADFQ